MKRLFLLLLAVTLVIGVFPVSAMAFELDDPEFDAFLKGIGWEKQDYIDYLKSKGWSEEDLDYWYIEELGTPLTEENLQPVLDEFDLTREELNALLREFGDLDKGQDVLNGEWIIFVEDLQFYLDYYLNLTPINEENLQELLDYYGFESKDELEEFLNTYGDSLEYYAYIEDLEWSLDTLIGPPIDDSTLQELLEIYGFESREALEAFLNQHGDSIDNYQYIGELENAIYMYQEEVYLEEVYSLFAEIGLTKEELNRLFAHFETLELDESFFDKWFELSERMIQFVEFDSASDLTAEQIAELIDIYQDFLELFELKTEYYLVNGDDKRTVSLESLITTFTTDGYDLLIEIYNTQGDFLADILLTAEMFGSELVKKTGQDLKKAQEIVVAKPEAPEKPQADTAPVQTIKGGKLPNTASDYAGNALFGIALIVGGLLLFLRTRAKGN